MPSDSIKIGFITGLTGPHAAPARSQSLGVQLAIEEMNDQGGILGKKIELVVRDDGMDPARSKKHAQELIQEEKVDAVTGTLSAGTILAINEECVQAGVPMVGICQTNVLTNSGHLGPYSFHEALTPHITAQMISKWAIKNLGKRWVLMYYDFPFGHDTVASFKEMVPLMGGEIVSIIEIPLGTTPEEYARYFPDILAQKPDVLSVTNFGEDQISFMRAAHQAGLVEEMSIVHTISDLFIVDSIPLEQLVGMHWSVNFYWQLEQTIPSAKSFVERFRNRWNGELPTGYSGYGYSGMIELLKGLEAGGVYPLDKNKMTEFLEGRSYDHYKGRQWWRPCDHQSFQDIYMMRFKGPEESQSTYDIGEIIDTVKWDLDIERTCQHLGHKEFIKGHVLHGKNTPSP